MGRRALKSLLATPAWMSVHLVAILVLIVAATRTAIQYIAVFEATDALLGPPTIGVLRFSFDVVHYWYILFLALFFIDGPAIFLLGLLPGNLRWLRHVWFCGVLMLILLTIGWVLLVLSIEFSHNDVFAMLGELLDSDLD